MPEKEETNGQLTKDVYMTTEIADLFKGLLIEGNEAHAISEEARKNSNQVQSKINVAMTMIGIADKEIVGGDLDSDNPYFRVNDDDGVTEQQ
jgi:hypothetical protein|tara:strand:- start:1677 stop:1952 length:276 start_codon:yes stop_codon:yes gene_type:complete